MGEERGKDTNSCLWQRGELSPRRSIHLAENREGKADPNRPNEKEWPNP